MKSFILDHLDELIAEWETFATTLAPSATTMDSLALRDHVRQILEAIAKDIATSQTDAEQDLKSRGLGPVFEGVATAAATHGALRHEVGFDLRQLVAEFRALRASVLRLWVAKGKYNDPRSVYEMTRFNEAIDQALAESVATYSDELGKSRDTFLTVLGNDLLAPVTAFSTVLDILEARPDETQASAALVSGKRNVTAISGMVRDLLEYTRSRLGHGIPITPSNANIGAICRAAINEASLTHPRVEFRFEAAGLLDGWFDTARMQQVISNLLANALHHCRRGTPVSVVARGDAEAFVLEVRNEGLPIAPDLLQVVFNPLVQLPLEGSEDPRRYGSLGLGLFIAREIVRAHGGKIDAVSTAETGTTFTVSLPRFTTKSRRKLTPEAAEKVEAARNDLRRKMDEAGLTEANGWVMVERIVDENEGGARWTFAPLHPTQNPPHGAERSLGIDASGKPVP